MQREILGEGLSRMTSSIPEDVWIVTGALAVIVLIIIIVDLIIQHNRKRKK